MRGLRLGLGFGKGGGGGTVNVLTAFVDNLDQDPPAVSFQTSQEGTLYIDYHSSATPPTLGFGDVGGTTEELEVGEWTATLDLQAHVGETFYPHFTLVYNTDQVSNTLTGQQITVAAIDATAILDRTGSIVRSRNNEQLDVRAI